MRLIRYPDLKQKGVVNSRMTLKRLIDDHGFPPGVLVTPNARAMTEFPHLTSKDLLFPRHTPHP